MLKNYLCDFADFPCVKGTNTLPIVWMILKMITFNVYVLYTCLCSCFFFVVVVAVFLCLKKKEGKSVEIVEFSAVISNA